MINVNVVFWTELSFVSQALSINLYSADYGRRLLDTAMNFNLDPNSGQPEQVSV